MSKICFYHNDFDGECSAAIFLRKIAGICSPINYNKEFPFEIIHEEDEVWIVDYSLKKDEWEKLLKITKNVIWIDHHKSAIEKEEEYGLSNLKGIRDISKSGCALTWEFCYIDIDSPDVVKLVEDYDIWKFKFGNKTKNFHQALFSIINTDPKSDFWEETLKSDDDDVTEYIDSLCLLGEKINTKNAISNKGFLNSWSFETIFEGRKCIAVNKIAGAILFDSIKENYDFFISFMFNGNNYSVSLYQGKDKETDLSKIAIKYGGGGHFGAAGFQCKELPFKAI